MTFGKIKEPFIVPAPDPYIIDLDGYDNPDDVIRSLTEKVVILRQAMALLDISELEARQQHYTLNSHTWSELYYRAMHANNHEACMFLQDHVW